MIRFLVVFDVDSTLIEDEAIELLAAKAGQLEKVASITEKAMRGEIDFSQSLVERVSTLKGLPESVLAETSLALRPTLGSDDLVRAIHDRGGLAAAVSGGFMQLMNPLKEKLGLDFVQANTLEVVDGFLSGRVTGEIIDGKAKADFLRSLAHKHDLAVHQTIAVGDGANDIEMIRAAGLGVAFCAKPKLKENAQLALEDRDLSQLISVLP